jgi:hypothetical protein
MLHRRTDEQRNSIAAAVDLLPADTDARRRPTSLSTTPPPPHLSFATLLGDWTFSCALAAAPLPPAKLR